jgi:hypothetical protein
MGRKVTELYQTLNSDEYSVGVRQREISFVVKRERAQTTS